MGSWGGGEWGDGSWVGASVGQWASVASGHDCMDTWITDYSRVSLFL